MKIVVYMGQSVNGYIAKEDDDTSFVSEKSWESFEKLYQKIGNIVIGKTTFGVSLLDNSFPYPRALNVVMTHKPVENKWGNEVVFTDKSPQQVVSLLKSKGFDTVFIAGGGKINAAFLEAELVDEIYLDIEPVIFGQGKPLFAQGAFESKLKLIETKMLSPNEIQLHYQVIK